VFGANLGSHFLKCAGGTSENTIQRWEDRGGCRDIPIVKNLETGNIGPLALSERNGDVLSHILYLINQGSNFSTQLKLAGALQTDIISEENAKDTLTSFLAYINDISINKYNRTPIRTVISIPVQCFDQKNTIIQLAKNARVDETKVCTDPTAIAYYFIKKVKPMKNGEFLIFNIGDTLSATTLKLSEKTTFTIEKTKIYSTFIGKSIEDKIYELVLEKIYEKYPEMKGQDIPKSSKKKLQNYCHQVNSALVNIEKTDVIIPDFINGCSINVSIERNDFEFAIDYIYDMIYSIFDMTISEYEDIKNIIFTGITSLHNFVKDITDNLGEEYTVFKEDFGQTSIGAALLANDRVNFQEKFNTDFLEMMDLP